MRPVDVGEGVAEEEDVGDRVLARQPGAPAGHLDPPQQLARVVAEDVDRPAGHLADRPALPRESIQMTARIRASPSSPTATVPDHWAVQPTPIRAAGSTPASRQGPAGGAADGRPPLVGVLLGTTPLQQVEGDRLGGVGHDPPGRSTPRPPWSAGPEVDGQHARLAAAAAGLAGAVTP